MLNRNLSLVVALVVGACGRAEHAKDDPSKPAIVSAPKVILPGDTAKPDTTPQLEERTAVARQVMLMGYAMVATTSVLGDSRTLTSLYDSAAVLITPSFRAEGAKKVVAGMQIWAQQISLKDMQRGSMAVRFLPDSIVVDTGVYDIVAQRAGQPEVKQRGAYATTWRMRPPPQDWLILSDHLHPPSSAQAASKAPDRSPGTPASQGRPAAPATASGAAGPPSLRSPSATALAAQGPDSFDLAYHTTKGRFTVRLRRAWSPKGADRVFHAASARYYDGARFYRVIPGFMAQFGFHGDPKVTAAWEQFPLRDEPGKMSNTRGMLTFANRGPNTRTVQLFVNTANNGPSLDPIGFNPIGSVLEGMSVVDALYSGYGEGAPRGPGPDQGQITANGNAYLSKSFPKLDGIDSARIVKRWP